MPQPLSIERGTAVFRPVQQLYLAIDILQISHEKLFDFFPTFRRQTAAPWQPLFKQVTPAITLAGGRVFFGFDW